MDTDTTDHLIESLISAGHTPATDAVTHYLGVLGKDAEITHTHELPDRIARLLQIATAATAAAMAHILAAQSSGAMAESDCHNPVDYVRAACDTRGVPLDSHQATQIRILTTQARTPGTADLVKAATTGRLPMTSLSTVANQWAQIRGKVATHCWDIALNAFIDWAADGEPASRLAELTDLLLQNYGITMDPDDDREERLHRHRAFTGFAPTKDGMRKATLLLDPADAATVEAAIAALSTPNPEHPRNTSADTNRASAGASENTNAGTRNADSSSSNDRGSNGRPARHRHQPGDAIWARDLRSNEQRRADALVTLAAFAAAPAAETTREGMVRKPLTQLIVTLDLETLLAQLAHTEAVRTGTAYGSGARAGSGFTATDQPLSAATVRLLACQAEIIPAVLNGTGQPLDIGRAKRTATDDQIRALRLRDHGCTFPGCRMRAAWCDAHHLTQWQHLGETTMDNLALVCRYHHTLIHRRGYTGHLITDRTGQHIHWQRPTDPAPHPTTTEPHHTQTHHTQTATQQPEQWQPEPWQPSHSHPAPEPTPATVH